MPLSVARLKKYRSRFAWVFAVSFVVLLISSLSLWESGRPLGATPPHPSPTLSPPLPYPSPAVSPPLPYPSPAVSPPLPYPLVPPSAHCVVRTLVPVSPRIGFASSSHSKRAAANKSGDAHLCCHPGDIGDLSSWFLLHHRNSLAQRTARAAARRPRP